MRNKEIKEKFEKLDEQIKSLKKDQEDLYEITRFILTAIRKYTNEPIYQVRNSSAWDKSIFAKEYILQYACNGKVKEIATYANIRSVELFAYCDTHFILKNHDSECFLVDMEQETITKIPAELLFSKDMSLTLEGKVLKICHTGPGVLGVRHENQSSN